MSRSPSGPGTATAISSRTGGDGRRRRSGPYWSGLAGAEVVLVAAVVLGDVLVPTLVVLVLLVGSLLARREGPATLGVRRWPAAWRGIAQVVALTVGWTGLQLALFLPMLEHLIGARQDVEQFAGLQGDVGMLLGWLALSWTLAAVGEELVYRGYLQTRISDVLGAGTTGVVLAVLGSSVLFGLAHSEQGWIGVAASFLDGVFFSVLRLRYRTLWAPVLAHGLTNTIGLIGFFLLGPVHGLW